jgi:hypothetical protein
MKAGLNNVVLPTLLIFVNNIVTLLRPIEAQQYCVTLVDNNAQCGQHKHCSMVFYKHAYVF